MNDLDQFEVRMTESKSRLKSNRESVAELIELKTFLCPISMRLSYFAKKNGLKFLSLEI